MFPLFEATLKFNTFLKLFFLGLYCQVIRNSSKQFLIEWEENRLGGNLYYFPPNLLIKCIRPTNPVLQDNLSGHKFAACEKNKKVMRSCTGM